MKILVSFAVILLGLWVTLSITGADANTYNVQAKIDILFFSSMIYLGLIGSLIFLARLLKMK